MKSVLGYVFISIVFVCLFPIEIIGIDNNLSSKQLQHYFEWGEYDSLGIILEANRSSFRDNLFLDTAKARYFLYFGVFRFAQGRFGDAQEYFKQSFLNNPNIALDARYVSKENYELFQLTRANMVKEHTERFRNDSLLKSREIALKKTSEMLRSIDIQKSRRTQYTIFFTTISFAIATAVLSGYEYINAEQKYQIYKNAVYNGDIQTANENKSLVDGADRLSLVFGLSSIFFIGGSTYLGIKIKSLR